LKEGGLAVHGGHDAAQVAGLYRVLGHLEGHARYLGVALGELAAAAYHADGHQLFHEARVRLQGVGELLAGVGPVLEHAREVAGGVSRGEGAAALYSLFDHLERQVLLVLKRKDVAQELDVLGLRRACSPRGCASG
jgi:hypothetical protein